ncbi:glycosyltransferase [Marinobacter sediminum]|uniref:glycosyltransferase n=1 Tax=Marinobacter sediminum TaxID=256323 RepID=UPI002030C030|nr:glycosyltransferase [Marinobacter sediminum]MCM0611824.1 glycosyltransferase [Marinobacter sediminum]
MRREICWITWEDHRRSTELAKELDADYHFVTSNETFIFRHLFKTLKTVLIIFRYRKGLVVVQNPSRVLAGLAALMKLFLRFPLVVDRHTNFRLGKRMSINPAVWFVILCSEFSLRVADLTIVTNDFLKNLVEKKGGRAIILHDKIPDIRTPQKKLDLPAGKNVLFVCTYAPDEPYMRVIEAASQLHESFHIHITGNYKKAGLDPNSKNLPSNVHLLGFISKEDYDAYVFSCDVIMVLTTSDWVIVCGGYEAAAAKKPLITSKTEALLGFYQGHAFHTEPNSEAIAEAVTKVCCNIQLYGEQMSAFSEAERQLWEEQWFSFMERVSTL